MFPFLAPQYLWLLLGVLALAAAYVVQQVRRKRYVARFSNVELLGSVAPRRPGWRRHLTFGLVLVALSVLTLGVAQPSAAVRVPRDDATVVMAIDVSLSMEATDVLPSRISAAKSAAKTFIKIIPSRINLGLLSFAHDASVVVPPTLNRAQLVRGVNSLHLANYTAIGEAIFGSLQAISVFTQATTPKGGKAPAARIVLLSDGSNTVGRTVASAIDAARQAHVEVSTIAFGTPTGTVQSNGQTIAVPADETTLRRIATETGGSFHTAHSEQELRSVYRDIGSQIGYTTKRRNVSWRYLLIGLGFLFAAGASSMLWAGRLA
jgi:Ca-activated chloride channel family protein